MQKTKIHELIACAILILASFWVVYSARTLVVAEKLRANLYPEMVPTSNFVKVPIFIYHSVRPYSVGESRIQDVYDITPELFEQQLVYLQNYGYTTITLGDLVKDIANGTISNVAKPVILTFDDGWENQYKYAFPLLQKYHMSATFYVFTNPIGKVEHFLTWNQVREMDRAGMIIASHTLSHPYLDKISPDELKKEIIESKSVLESELGKPVVDFASPFGYTSTTVVNVIKDAGYLTGRTTRRGVYQTKDDLFELRGILVSDNFDDFVKVLDH